MKCDACLTDRGWFEKGYDILNNYWVCDKCKKDFEIGMQLLASEVIMGKKKQGSYFEGEINSAKYGLLWVIAEYKLDEESDPTVVKIEAYKEDESALDKAEAIDLKEAIEEIIIFEMENEDYFSDRG